MAITKKTFFAILVLGAYAVLLWFFINQNNEEVTVSLPVQPTVESDITIIAFGDSLTAGFGLPANESYPAQLEKMLNDSGWSARVINAGVSGETTRGNLERASFIRSQNPDMVLLGIGGNDALRMLPFEETKKNISNTIETLKSGENPPEIILLIMQAPLSSGASYKQSFDSLYSDLADTYNLKTSRFITEEVFFDNSKKLSDGIHFNKDGYEKIARDYILPVVIEKLETID